MSDERQPSILILDDDEIILVALTETMAHQEYRLVQTTSGFEALELVKHEKFEVIISDQRMAELTGLEFFEEVKRIQPNASRILITGVLTLNTLVDAVNKGEIYRFIAKPWIREELIATVRNAVRRAQLIDQNQKLWAATLRLNDELSNTNQQLKESIAESEKQREALTEARDQLRRSFNHSLELCVRLIGSFHPLVGRDTRAVVLLCNLMLGEMPLARKEEHLLRLGAYLQNLGLIRIHRDIYRRARQNLDSLNEEERRQIELHPLHGQTIIGFLDDFAEVGPIVRAHHEAWDGSGYPDGLAGEAIPRPARWLAVACWYVECGLPRDEALRTIEARSGKQFDPEAVRVFLRAVHKLPERPHVRQILFHELQVGQVLARALHAPNGLLMLPEGHTLSPHSLQKLREFNEIDPLTEEILVHDPVGAEGVHAATDAAHALAADQPLSSPTPGQQLPATPQNDE